MHYKPGVLKGVIKKQAIQNELEFNFRGTGHVFLLVTLNLLLVVFQIYTITANCRRTQKYSDWHMQSIDLYDSLF